MRWARILRALGHRVAIAENYEDERCDLLVALHARRSAGAVSRSRNRHPARPVVVALTGTDVYQDIHVDREAQEALELADRLVALQPLALDELPPHVRGKGRVIYQSAEKTEGPIRRRGDVFQVCVIGHLRKVKDPFRAAYAARRLPESSAIRIVHVGAPREDEMEGQARAEESANPRYQWLGGVSAAKARRILAESRLLVLSSRMEGGANVISEAVVDGVPVLASRIPGSVGLLGDEYPGYFPFGDTDALAGLLSRAELDPEYYRSLDESCRKLETLFHPARERSAWELLLQELA